MAGYAKVAPIGGRIHRVAVVAVVVVGGVLLLRYGVLAEQRAVAGHPEVATSVGGVHRVFLAEPRLLHAGHGAASVLP